MVKKIAWVSSHGYFFDPHNFTKEVRLELWIMDADGNNKTRLTYFNEPGYPEYTGVKTSVGDNCWSPDGKKILFKIRLREGVVSKEKIGILEFIEEPKVVIKKPIQGYLYIFNREIMQISLNESIVIGKITIEADTYGNVEKVEFYIDGKLKYTDCNSPYSWLWDEHAVGKHKIVVIAYDEMGKMASAQMQIKIFNI